MDNYLIVGISALLLGAFAGFMLGHGFGRKAGLREAQRPPSPLGGIFCLVGAGAMLLLAIGTTTYSIYFLAASTPTDGVVVDIRESTDKDGGTSIFPTYSFHDAAGHEYTGDTHYSDGTSYAVGYKIRVRYITSSPGNSRVDSFTNHWDPPLFFAFGALVLAVIGQVLRWHYQNQVRKETAKNVPLVVEHV